MTRAILAEYIAVLDHAAREKGMRIKSVIGESASHTSIAGLESQLGVALPQIYRESLREWDGFLIEVREPPTASNSDGSYYAEWSALDVVNIIAATKVVREQINNAAEFADDVVRAGAASAAQRMIVISSLNDICVFLSEPDEQNETRVRAMNLEYALGDSPPESYVIARSPDDYFDKGFAKLSNTLETEVYWW
jgi:hypothetical protein